MSTEQHLRRLEQHYGLDGQSSRSPCDRALDRIANGIARRRDFEIALENTLWHWQLLIAARSAYFRELRDKGWLPWSAWPLDVAADLASYQPDEEPPERITARAAEWVDRPIFTKPGTSRSLDDNGRDFVLGQWKERNIAHVALYPPDDLELRVQIAMGCFVGAAKYIMDETPYGDMLSVNRPTCRPWQPIPGMAQERTEPYGDWWPDFSIDWDTDDTQA